MFGVLPFTIFFTGIRMLVGVKVLVTTTLVPSSRPSVIAALSAFVASSFVTVTSTVWGFVSYCMPGVVPAVSVTVY